MTKMQGRFERHWSPGMRYAKGDDGRYIDARTQQAYFFFCLGAEALIKDYEDFMGASGYASGRQYVIGGAERRATGTPSASAPKDHDQGSDEKCSSRFR
jgi:hypothetical protein